MKKFLTFFALLCALLGFSPSVMAWTFYVDVSKNGWTDAYIHLNENNNWSSPQKGTVVDNTDGKVYKFDINGYSNLNGIHFTSTNRNDRPADGTNGNGTYWRNWTQENKDDAWQMINGRCYILNSENGSTFENDYTPPAASTYPTLYFRGAQIDKDWSAIDKYKFNRDGNVYTLTISEGITGEWKIADNNWTVGYVWGGPDKQTVTLSDDVRTALNKSNDSGNIIGPSGSGSCTVKFEYSVTGGTSYVTVTYGTPKPAKPELPEVATSNKVTIPAVSGANVYYMISATDPGTPSKDTWTKYTGPIELNAANVTIWAAALSTDETQWSEKANQSYTYGMPVPTVVIDNNGTVTISVSPIVDGAKLKYGISETGIDEDYDASNKPQVAVGTTVYAQYVHTILGSSTVAQATYAGAKTVKSIELYTRKGIQDGYDSSGTPEGPDAEGVYKAGSVDIPSGFSGQRDWYNSTLSVRVKYSDESYEWYTITKTEAVGTIQPNSWRTAYKRDPWPTNTNANCGFQVEGSGGKTVTVYAKFVGSGLQIMATMPENNLKIGSSAPQITGYGIPSNAWNNYEDFSKVSDSPKSYEYVFTCGDANGSQEYVWYGLKINDTQYRPANLSLGESTYTFTQGAPSQNNQATIKGLTTGVNYALVLTETEVGLCLSITEAGIPVPVLKRNAKENVVTINVPVGCTLHYTIAGETEKTATSKVTLTIPTGGLTVADAYFVKGTETGTHVTNQTFSYYTAPQRWATKEWTLSDDGIMPKNTVKYFYMSRFQNDDRVSPEWELIKNGNTYTLKNFMVIPAGEFRLRRIAKDGNGNLSYHDYGINSSTRVQPADLGVTGATASAQSYSTTKTLTKDKSRGYVWDMGYSMATVSVTDATTSNDGNATIDVTMSIDFSQPSTAKVALKPGMPYVALTGQNLQVPAVDGQTIMHVADIPDNNSFTNAWIQYDENSNMLVYGSDITTSNGVYKGDTDHAPNAGCVIQSTIMPPRYPIWFKLIDENGNESQITSNKVILKYDKEVTRTFTTPDEKAKTKDNVRFARYTLNDLEMSGRYKIFSGYGGHDYGSVVNGLSLFANWGVGAQPDKDEYASSKIDSDVAVPLNGAGPKTDTNDYASRNGSDDTNSNYDKEDNYAGRYFIFNQRTYVSELEFLYALERDQEGANGTGTYLDGQWNLSVENYSSHHAHRTDASNNQMGPHWDQPSYTNNGINYSWFRLSYAGSIGKIVLDKTGIHSGEVSWSINEDGKGQDKIKKYKVTFYMVDPSKQPGEEGYIKDAYKVVVPETELSDPDNIIVQLASEDELDLKPGWYEACLEFIVDTVDENNVPQENVKKTLYSNRIIIFEMAAAGIKAEQRVTDADDGLKIYHPVIDVTPDASASISALDKGIQIESVYASIVIDNISTSSDTRLVDKDGNALPTEQGGTPRMYVDYDRTNGKATVHYPKGFFTSRTVMPEMRFAVRNAAIGERTNVVMTISAEGAPDATSDDYTNVYMPAGVLYGKLVPEKVKNEDVEFNALAVTNQDDLPEGEMADGYARIRYVDKNNNDEPCYIGTMGSTEVMALVKYIANDGTEKVLFGGEKLNMRFNPDDTESVYTSKRLKIAGIPYETETATDAAGEEIKVRKDQTAKFSVQLTYSIAGYEPFVAREMPTTLTYEAKELTSPRKDLADLKTKDDVRGETNADGKTIATDVTAITESFVENYGGLFTNIEDAHVALAAVAKNDALIGYNSLDKWYMDHGDKYDDGKVNPHAPVNRRAIGHKDLTGTTTFDTPAKVHPLLRDGASKVTTARDFQNTSTVNNAWWNSSAQVAPAFHEFDHIKGDFVRDPSTHKILGWKSESSISKPSQHRAYWAGVKYENKDAYKSVWNNGVLEVHDGFSVDVRDPKHGYYSMSTHFSKPTYPDEDGTEKPLRTAFHLGEMPLNANDIVAFYGNQNDVKGVKAYLGEFQTLRDVAMPIHEQINNKISDAQYGNDGKATAEINGKTYTLDIPLTEPWNYDNVDVARTKLAFTRQSDVAGLTDESPAEKLFNTAISNDGQQHHMFFKVRHVNHESWFVPGGVPEGVLKTQPLWDAFKSVTVNGKTIDNYATAKEKDNFVMNAIRMDFDDYCPLAYDVRYTYPFLTTEKVTAENYDNSRTNVAAYAAEETTDPTQDFNRIKNMYAHVTPEEVSDVAARDTGRVPFFGTMTASPEEIVPTAISDVNDDIRGAGFSIVYNRAAGTVTITADGDRELKDAAVYDATGASLVSGTSADRISDQIIVLDVRNISRGAYVISTNLGGAKFMK